MIYSMHEIDAAVSTRFQLHPWELRSPDRARRVARPRQIAMFLCREYGKPYTLIGRHYSKDHTTILHGVRRIRALTQVDPEMGRQIAGVREILALRPSWRAVRVTELYTA